MRSKRLLSLLLLVPILLLAVSTDPLREAKALYAKGEWTKATKAICARISAKSDEKFYEPYILENPSKTFNISKSDLQILLDIETDDKL